MLATTMAVAAVTEMLRGGSKDMALRSIGPMHVHFFCLFVLLKGANFARLFADMRFITLARLTVGGLMPVLFLAQCGAPQGSEIRRAEAAGDVELFPSQAALN